MLNTRIVSIVALSAALFGCATQPAPSTMAAPASVAEAIGSNPSLSTLNGLVVKAGLSDMLKGNGPYTVFAPTNDAFKAVPAKTMDELAKDPAKLKAVLAFHVLPGKVMAGQVKLGKATTANGANVQLAKAGAYDNTIFHRNIPGFMVNILISYLNTNIYVNFIRKLFYNFV